MEHRPEGSRAVQAANIRRARTTARSKAATLRSIPFSASTSRLARAERPAQLAVADDPGERAGQLAGVARVGEQRVAIRHRDVAGGAGGAAADDRQAGRDRLAHDHAERLVDRRQDERVGGRVDGGQGVRRGRSRRTAPPRPAARRARAARPRAGRCRRRAAPPRPATARAKASIRPPKFFSGTSRPTASTRTGPPSGGSAPATAARIGSASNDCRLTSTASGATPMRQQAVAGRAAGDDEPLGAGGEPAVEPALRAPGAAPRPTGSAR